MFVCGRTVSESDRYTWLRSEVCQIKTVSFYFISHPSRYRRCIFSCLIGNNNGKACRVGGQDFIEIHFILFPLLSDEFLLYFYIARCVVFFAQNAGAISIQPPRLPNKEKKKCRAGPRPVALN